MVKRSYRYIYWRPKLQKYQAFAKVSGRLKNLGLYEDSIEAFLARVKYLAENEEETRREYSRKPKKKTRDDSIERDADYINSTVSISYLLYY